LDSVIFSEPIVWICYGAALFCCVFDLIKKSSGIILPVLSVAFSAAASVCALLLGATLYEVATVILILLSLNLISFIKRGGGSDKGEKGDKK